MSTDHESPESEEGWTVFRLPRSHWHCGLSNFNWDGVRPQSTRAHVEKFLAEMRAGRAPHLMLTGAPGVGKSHLGVAIYRAGTVAFGTEMVTWINVPAYCEKVKRGYGDGFDPWTDIEAARRLVVLDDLFGRALSAHEAEQIIYRLIDTAYQNNAAVMLTMNPDVKELQQRLAGHEISRLLASSTIIPMTADKDYRRG